MRQIYTYRAIRYFPHVLSDEFINVGVVLDSEKGVHRILSEEEAKQIHCTALIGDKKKFLGFIEYLNNLASENRLLEEEHYFHNFRFAAAQKVASEKSARDVVRELFDDYVGFKIHSENKREQKEIIMDRSIRLIEKEFKNYIKYKTGDHFDLILESIQSKTVHYSDIGRISWKQDIARMILSVPQSAMTNDKNHYDFLNITGAMDAQDPYVQKLRHNFVDVYPYKTEEEIASYLETVAKAA